jgi:hypothetical protein
MPRSKHEARRDSAARADQERNIQTPQHGSTSDGQRDQILDEGLGLSPRGSLADAVVPSGQAEVIDDEPELTTSPHLLDGADATTPDLEPSLIDQEILTDPMAAAGDTDDPPTDEVDPVADGDEVYVPPVDPVVTAGASGDPQVLGGFALSAEEEIRPRRSASDGQVGDEAIADAVRSALAHDAATADLEIEVIVERGIVRLRGQVSGMEDVDNAEAVAGRVPGVVDVAEELDVAEL